MITSAELRELFLGFFRERGHRVVPSSSVIPHGDPTLLFTNAGMNQFKDIFLGREKPEFPRAASVQKCVRASGKHNDLEDVGRDGRHHTFFEMLGNWSFGDYYKKEAIQWAWELVTGPLGLPAECLWATVYRDDEESYALWREMIGLPAERVVRLGDLEAGDEENFWSMGDTGPCGPCSELHYRYPVPGKPDFLRESQEGTILELWNLVFMEFNRQDDGTLVPLPARHVDTGMGLERTLAVLQGTGSNYQTDLFTPIMEEIRAITGADPEAGLMSFRVIADHIRALAFTIADGALPSNEGRGYVIRRILRRAVRHGRLLGMTEPFLYRLTGPLYRVMQPAYPELEERRRVIETVIRSEEELFLRTLDTGLEEFNQAARRARSRGEGVISGREAFVLHDTYGFPIDLTSLLAAEQGLRVDQEGFELAMEEQRERARREASFRGGPALGSEEDWTVLGEDEPTVFEGYERLTLPGMRLLRYREENGEMYLVFDRTPFYAESGGQVADTGVIEGEGARIRVRDVRRAGDRFVHVGALESGGLPGSGEHAFTGRVDRERRWDIMANHTATHLLHHALREVLGEQAQQAGSLVAPDRLRFDFNHYQPLTGEQLDRVQDLVNRAVLDNRRVIVSRDVELEKAREMGATALFGEKYGATVRVVQVEGLNTELCGGTHVSVTGEIGLFMVLRESSVSAGVRRVEAVTRHSSYRLVKRREALLQELADLAGADPESLPQRVRQLQDTVRDLQKKLKQERKRVSGAGATGQHMVDAGPFKAGVVQLEDLGAEEMRELADSTRARVPDGVLLMVSEADGKTTVLLAAGEQAVKQGVHAGKLLGEVLGELGGKGGGRPHLAQGGGIEAGDARRAFDLLRRLLQERAG
ncbi:MAG: alanine--tRNA ligase [Spirochaetota bacterium]